MPIQFIRNEVPQALQRLLIKGISSVIGSRKGQWQVEIVSEATANAWDVEITGPNGFYWARRFSAEDRDIEVIAEAIRAALIDQAA